MFFEKKLDNFLDINQSKLKNLTNDHREEVISLLNYILIETKINQCLIYSTWENFFRKRLYHKHQFKDDIQKHLKNFVDTLMAYYLINQKDIAKKYNNRFDYYLEILQYVTLLKKGKVDHMSRLISSGWNPKILCYQMQYQKGLYNLSFSQYDKLKKMSIKHKLKTFYSIFLMNNSFKELFQLLESIPDKNYENNSMYSFMRNYPVKSYFLSQSYSISRFSEIVLKHKDDLDRLAQSINISPLVLFLQKYFKVEIKELNTQSSLNLESIYMKHCVHTYKKRVKDCKSRIFHIIIFKDNSETHSTVEISYESPKYLNHPYYKKNYENKFNKSDFSFLNEFVEYFNQTENQFNTYIKEHRSFLNTTPPEHHQEIAYYLNQYISHKK